MSHWRLVGRQPRREAVSDKHLATLFDSTATASDTDGSLPQGTTPTLGHVFPQKKSAMNNSGTSRRRIEANAMNQPCFINSPRSNRRFGAFRLFAMAIVLPWLASLAISQSPSP